MKSTSLEAIKTLRCGKGALQRTLLLWTHPARIGDRVAESLPRFSRLGRVGASVAHCFRSVSASGT